MSQPVHKGKTVWSHSNRKEFWESTKYYPYRKTVKVRDNLLFHDLTLPMILFSRFDLEQSRLIQYTSGLDIVEFIVRGPVVWVLFIIDTRSVIENKRSTWRTVSGPLLPTKIGFTRLKRELFKGVSRGTSVVNMVRV